MAGEDAFRASVDARVAALDKTDALLADSVAQRRAQLAARVRTFYKVSRTDPARLWVDSGERAAVGRRRAAVARILRRDISELAIFQLEQKRVALARARLAVDRAAPLSLPAPRSLFRPIVSGRIAGQFGYHVDRGSRARLVRHGIEMSTHAGRNVRAVEAGTVRFVGPLRGLGAAIVIAHPGGYMSVLARLGAISVAAGQSVDRGQAVGEAGGDRVYLEIRALAGVGGFAVDPAPLLE
jgi:septal ring factor EnvC (AmiA/AmiB activator)